MAAKPSALAVVHWVLRIIVAAIFVMGAVPKFTGGAGALAEVLPGGSMAVMAIGIAEVVSVVLILVPKTALVGSVAASLIMIGAVGSHVVGPVGMEGDFQSMFVMALIALVAALGSAVIGWKRRGSGVVTSGS